MKSRPGTVLVRSGVQYNNKTMCNHGGAAHSCSSFADLVLKSIQRFKEKYPWRAGGLFLARARARGTRAHVRNVPSSVLPKSTVRNLESSCTGCMFLLFEGL